jgi:hypothetical protein
MMAVRNFHSRFSLEESRVLGRIFGPKRDEATEEWRRLHNEDLHALYFSPDITFTFVLLFRKKKLHADKLHKLHISHNTGV